MFYVLCMWSKNVVKNEPTLGLPVRVYLSLFVQPTRNILKRRSLIYMRHGPLATDAGVISPTRNYTHQLHLFCMDDSQHQIRISPLCLSSDTEYTNSTNISSISFWRQTKPPFYRIQSLWTVYLTFLFLPSSYSSLRASTFLFLSPSPHPASHFLGLIGIRHAVGDKVRPTRGSVFLMHRHRPMSQHRDTPSDPSARFIPPALGPYGK